MEANRKGHVKTFEMYISMYKLEYCYLLLYTEITTRAFETSGQSSP